MFPDGRSVDWAGQSDETSRLAFVEFLSDLGVGGIDGHPARASFVDGSADISFADLHVDSLALMEIGIGLEDRYGVSLSPNAIVRFVSVSQLLEVALKRQPGA
jgi:acyl carrier protein